MRVLFVTPDLPHPPFHGAHTRPLSMIEALARRHEVILAGSAPRDADLSLVESLCTTVCCLRRDPYRRGAVGTVLARCRAAFTPVPLIGRSRFRQVADLVSEAARRYQPEAQQLQGMYTVHYRIPGVPAVMDMMDIVSGLCEAAGAARPFRYAATGIQQSAAARAESRLLPAFSRLIALNTDDAARLGRLGLAATVIPLALKAPESPPPPPPSGPIRLLFVGNFGYKPNREAGLFLERQLAPALQTAGIDFRLTIAGCAARSQLAHTSRPVANRPPRAACPRSDSDRQVCFAADVPDLAPLYRDAHVVLVPLAFGGGTKNKTVEAMAWARPVIGSPQAFTGIDPALAGVGYVTQSLDARVMAHTLAQLADDRPRCRAMGRAARDYVLAEHSQATVDELVLGIYEEIGVQHGI